MNETTNPTEGVVEQDAPVADEVQAEEVEAALDQTDEADQSAEGEPGEDEFEEIVHNGESKRLSKAELKELAQKGYDYTVKTQDIAQEREMLRREREAAAMQAQASQQLAEHRARVIAIDQELAKFAGIDPVALATSNPAEYARLNAQVQQLQAMRAQAASVYENAEAEVVQQHQAIVQERAQRELQRLVEKMPEISDARKATEFQSKVGRFLGERYGIAPQEVSSVVNLFDHRSFLLLRDLMDAQAAKAAVPKGKPISNAPPPPAKVAGNSTTATTNPERLNTENWMRWRNKQASKGR